MLSEVQERDLEATLSMRFEQVLLTFSTIDARSAEAGDKDAKLMLVKLLEDRPGGFGAVNICITKMLREWLLRIARRFEEHGNSNDLGLLAGLGELERILGSDLRKALMYHERSLELRRRRLGTSAADIALSEHHIGGLLDGMARASEALPYFARALETRQILGDCEATADSHAGIGRAYQCLSDGPLALTMFAQALKPYKSLPRTEDRIADTLNNIGTVHGEEGNHLEALQVACTCLPRIASSFRLGRRYCCVDLSEALRSRRIFSRLVGSTRAARHGRHPVGAHTLISSGRSRTWPIRTRSWVWAEEALKLHLDTLPIWEKLYGEQHENVAQGWYNIALCYDSMNRRDEALGAYSKASVAYGQVHGPSSSAVAHIQYNVAIVYIELGRRDEAMHLLRTALATQVVHASSQEAGTQPSGCSESNPADGFGVRFAELDIRKAIRIVQREAHSARSAGTFQCGLV